MARNLGCCGAPARPVSIAALVARADAYPASTHQGRVARARLLYTVAAGKAAQAGNRYAYDRAMQGLRGADLAELSTDPLTPGYHGAAAAATDAAVAAAPQIQATLQSLVDSAGSAQTQAVFAQARTAINVVLAAAGIGTGIASAACRGCDQNAITVINTVISWVRTLLNGTAPNIPALDANTVRGLVDFCRFKDPIIGIVSAAFEAGIAAALVANNTGGATALTTLQVWIVGILNGICSIPQIAAATAAVAAETTDAAADATCRSTTPNSMWDAVGRRCVCAPGYVPGPGRADGSAPCVLPGAGGGTSSGGPIPLSAEQRRAIVQAATAGPPSAATLRAREAARLIPMTLIPGTLDPVTLCAPGERGNPCSGVCDGGDYRLTPACVDGVPAAQPKSAIVWALPAAALAWYFFK